MDLSLDWLLLSPLKLLCIMVEPMMAGMDLNLSPRKPLFKETCSKLASGKTASLSCAKSQVRRFARALCLSLRMALLESAFEQPEDCPGMTRFLDESVVPVVPMAGEGPTTTAKDASRILGKGEIANTLGKTTLCGSTRRNSRVTTISLTLLELLANMEKFVAPTLLFTVFTVFTVLALLGVLKIAGAIVLISSTETVFMVNVKLLKSTQRAELNPRPYLRLRANLYPGSEAGGVAECFEINHGRTNPFERVVPSLGCYKTLVYVNTLVC